jgi:cbb3-type cytochrome c oxidase subunit III
MKQTIKHAALCAALLAGLGAAAAQKDHSDKQPARSRDAATLFAKNCASCHGQDGRARTLKAKFNHARDLTDAAWQREAGDERITNSISNGRGKMPKFGKKLSPSEIDSLAKYVRGLKK